MRTSEFRIHALALLLAALMGLLVPPAAQAESEPAPPQSHGMVFLQFARPEFRAGLQQHGMLGDAGFRLHHTGYRPESFGAVWRDSELLRTAQQSGRPYYLDRIMGGMPFQSLDGIAEFIAVVKDDPNFLGFQVHEWGNSPIHDYRRIQEHILDVGKPLNAESFAALEGRTESPYFSGGDYGVYSTVYRPIESQKDAETYLEAYFREFNRLTQGMVLSVTGYGQLHHAALRLGARNVMAEIGNQVPLTAFQIACLRGAARQYGKPFGTYYEPWGGQPFGCVRATDFSPWWPDDPKLKEKMDGYRIGPEYGSSRSLQRRLMYFAWISGSSWWSEEWGAENYFTNWEDYPLTPYAQVTREFQRVTAGLPGVEPVVPAAVVLPSGTFGLDIRVIAGDTDKAWQITPADELHFAMRRFAKAFFAPQPRKGGTDAYNLTPSPWIGCFDVFDADVSVPMLDRYACAVYFDQAQAATSVHPSPIFFDDSEEAKSRTLAALQSALPYRVEGRVGVAQARCGNRYLLGLFNNLGITKTDQGESADPDATQVVTVRGVTEGTAVLVGEAFLEDVAPDSVALRLPAGEVVVASFPTRD